MIDMSASRTIAPKASGVLKCEVDSITRKPKPFSAPTNSPMTAPITESVIATFRPEKKMRKRRRKADLGVNLQLRSCELASQVNNLWRRTAQARRRVYDYREKGHQERNDNFREISITEPDQQNRCKCDFRHRLGDKDQRVNRVAQRARMSDGHGKRHAECDCEQESKNRLVKRNPGVQEKVAATLHERMNNIHGRRQ